MIRLRHRTSRKSLRRGMAVAASVIVIAIVNVAIIGSVVGGGDDSRIAAMRTDTIRAFLAAESGVQIVVRELVAGRTPPEGELTLPGGERVDIQISGETPPIDVEVHGRYGHAVRRLEVRIE